MKHCLQILFWIALTLVACTGQATPTYYVPAIPASSPVRPAPTSTSEPVESLSSPQPTPAPDCQSNLLFLEDLTIPDGSQVGSREKLDKRWLVQNNGTCNWNQGYSLRLIAGPKMGADPERSLYPARSGNQVEIQIQFIAPQEPGTYRSAWQAADPGGNLFGDTIFIEVNVAIP